MYVFKIPLVVLVVDFSVSVAGIFDVCGAVRKKLHYWLSVLVGNCKNLIGWLQPGKPFRVYFNSLANCGSGIT